MHFDITFGSQVVESSSLVSVLFREALNHPYISLFHILARLVFLSLLYLFSGTPYLLRISGVTLGWEELK